MPTSKPGRGNPMLAKVAAIEARVDGHDRELAEIHEELAEHDNDIAMLADIIHRGKRRARLRIKSSLRAARGRGR